MDIQPLPSVKRDVILLALPDVNSLNTYSRSSSDDVDISRLPVKPVVPYLSNLTGLFTVFSQIYEYLNFRFSRVSGLTLTPFTAQGGRGNTFLQFIHFMLVKALTY